MCQSLLVDWGWDFVSRIVRLALQDGDGLVIRLIINCGEDEAVLHNYKGRQLIEVVLSDNESYRIGAFNPLFWTPCGAQEQRTSCREWVTLQDGAFHWLAPHHSDSDNRFGIALSEAEERVRRSQPCEGVQDHPGRRVLGIRSHQPRASGFKACG